MTPASPVYSTAWSSGRPSVPPPPPAMLPPAVRRRAGSYGRYIPYSEWLRRQGRGLEGMGLGQGTGQQIVFAAPQIAAATLGTASAMGAAWATAAIPVVGPIIAGVTVALMMIFGRKGPKQRVATTEIVNKVEPLLQQNLQGYLSGPRTVSSQAQALANFDAGWQFILDNCGIPEMGNPGKACISDRQAGACTWQEAGECWDWFKGYRDPIANDPQVKPDPLMDTATGSLVDALTGGIFTSGGGIGSTGLLIGLALLAVAFFVGGKP